MDLLDIVIAKQLSGGGGGSGTDNYNDLSNLPKINDTTLSGNKSSSALGLQSEINSDSKLASDLVDDTNQDNKFVTSTEKNTWNAKQNAIDADHKLSSDLVDDANKTNKFVTSTEKNTWNAKQNAIDADHKLSSSLVSFSTAEAAALASGIDSSKVGQISTNQTNILYGLQTGVKNWFDVAAEGNSQYGLSTYSADTETGTVDVASTTSSGSWARYRVPITLPAGTYTISGNVTNIVGFLDITGNTGVDDQGTVIISRITRSSTGNFSSDFTINAETSFYVAFYANYSGTAQNRSATVTHMMICPKSIYDQDSSYQPPSLPNYDLTRLETEDRAALAEEIDSGAKNKLPIDLAHIQSINTGGTWNNNVYTIANVTITVNSNKTITLNGTSSDLFEFQLMSRASGNLKLDTGNYTFSNSLTASTGGTWDIAVNRTVSGSGVRYGSDTGNGLEFTVTDASANTGVWIACNMAGVQFNNVTIKPMVCTKAAFGVSKAFVPYRPNYDLVGSAVSALNSTAYNAVSSASSYVKDIEGGYIQIGKLVIVNIRCTVNTEITSSTAFITGLPKSIVQYNQGYGAASVSNNIQKTINILGNGTIGVGNDTIAVGTIMILSAMYMAK